MNPLTKKEQAIILEAAELVETEVERFSCNALVLAETGDVLVVETDLSKRYAAFSRPNETLFWFDLALAGPIDAYSPGYRKHLRVLLLLNFLEANK